MPLSLLSEMRVSSRQCCRHQGAQQWRDALLGASIELALLSQRDQLLDLGGIDRLGLLGCYRHSRARKSFASGYAHTVLTGTCPRR